MTAPRIYIDGQEGSTGLRIRQILEGRDDIDLQLIPPADRKNADVRRQFLQKADIAVLCLPDAAAAEAIALVGNNGSTRIIDTSSALRVDPQWVYGLPELCPSQRQAIRSGGRVANPGCYPIGFILAVRPLIEARLLNADFPLTINGVSGYSGGGRKMIEAYQGAEAAPQPGDAAIPLSLYGLDGSHKHLPEMRQFSLTHHRPLFLPSVDHRYCGMLVSTPLPSASFSQRGITKQRIWDTWNDVYGGEPFVNPVAPGDSGDFLRDGSFLDLDGANFTNRVDLFVFGDEESGVILVGRQDNLGKGASGNAVQCLNLMLGIDEETGLTAGH